MVDALAHTLLRIFLLILPAFLVLIPVMLFSLYSIGEGLILFLGTLIMMHLGWALLPAIRASRILAVLMLAVWISVGVVCLLLGVESVKGWILVPWLMATLLNAYFLKKNPPKYWVKKM